MTKDLFGTEYDPSGAPLTQERLKEILHYDPETGEWRWLKKEVGNWGSYFDRSVRRWRIHIDGRYYRTSRLAHLYMTGVLPPEVDHKDTNSANELWNNLRGATRSQNQCNTGLSSRNISGYKGVSSQRTGSYTAKIYSNGKCFYLGSFRTPEAAHEAYKAKAIELHGEFANFGAPPQLKFRDLFA